MQETPLRPPVTSAPPPQEEQFPSSETMEVKAATYLSPPPPSLGRSPCQRAEILSSSEAESLRELTKPIPQKRPSLIIIHEPKIIPTLYKKASLFVAEILDHTFALISLGFKTTDVL